MDGWGNVFFVFYQIIHCRSPFPNCWKDGPEVYDRYHKGLAMISNTHFFIHPILESGKTDQKTTCFDSALFQPCRSTNIWLGRSACLFAPWLLLIVKSCCVGDVLRSFPSGCRSMAVELSFRCQNYRMTTWCCKFLYQMVPWFSTKEN